MKGMKTWISLALVGASLALASCAPKEPFKVLKIGFTDYQPMYYLDEAQGKWVGFDAEFARQVCDELGYQAEFVEIIWANKVRDLENGAIDCIWNGMTVTEELQEQILVSEPYMENRQVAVMPASAGATPPSVYTLERVSFEDGGVAEELLRAGELSASAYRAEATQKAALAAVLQGNSAAAVIDYTMARSLIGKGAYSSLAYYEIEGAPVEYYAVGFRKSDVELCEKVNALILKYQSDGTFAKWENTYLR